MGSHAVCQQLTAPTAACRGQEGLLLHLHPEQLRQQCGEHQQKQVYMVVCLVNPQQSTG